LSGSPLRIIEEEEVFQSEEIQLVHFRAKPRWVVIPSPINRIKYLGNIQFNKKGRGFLFVKPSEYLLDKNKVVIYASFYEGNLVLRYEVLQLWAQPVCHKFGYNFCEVVY
jgi:hypothetical protein